MYGVWRGSVPIQEAFLHPGIQPVSEAPPILVKGREAGKSSRPLSMREAESICAPAPRSEADAGWFVRRLKYDSDWKDLVSANFLAEKWMCLSRGYWQSDQVGLRRAVRSYQRGVLELVGGAMVPLWLRRLP